MTKFNIQKHKFTLDNEEYALKPLGGSYIGLLFEVLESFQAVTARIEKEAPVDATAKEKEKLSSEKFLSYLDKEALGKLHTLTLETFKVSYPNAKDEEGKAVDFEGFVTQNLFKLMTHVISTNMNTIEE